jgi:molybdate transport system substrate-binding protein
MRIAFFSLLLSLVFTETVPAGEVRVAVAANFRTTLNLLADKFETTSDHTLIISSGSTGRLYAQIVNGAPFDVFLAADSKRPALLIETGLAPEANLFDYAIGQLVLWSPAEVPPAEIRGWLQNLDRVAIANPRLAPYGLAARQTLEQLGANEVRIITGENVNQAFQFTASGNVSAGFVALAQTRAAGIDPANYWPVPENLHDPIRQQGVRLSESAAAAEFEDFLRTAEAHAIIEASGYKIPE